MTFKFLLERIIYGVLCQVGFHINFISKIYLYDMVSRKREPRFYVHFIWGKWVMHFVAAYTPEIDG